MRGASESLGYIQRQLVECWPGCTARKQARSGSLKQRLRILYSWVDKKTHEAVLHLVPILFAPEDELGRIRVVLVISGIVIVRNSHNARSLRYRKRLL